jgi:formylglycine-generating enzyme required for sulfatase activity
MRPAPALLCAGAALAGCGPSIGYNLSDVKPEASDGAPLPSAPDPGPPGDEPDRVIPDSGSPDSGLPDTGSADTGGGPTDWGGPADYPLLTFEAPGLVWMGSPDDELHRDFREVLHEREISRRFQVGVYEVTQGMVEELIGVNPAALHPEAGGVDGYGDACNQGGVGPHLPAVCLTWNQAVEVANALSVREGLEPAYVIEGGWVRWDRNRTGFRLLTEGEWEHVARAGYPDNTYGVTDDPTEVCRWYNVSDATATALGVTRYPFPCDDGHWHLLPPGSLPPTEQGVHDLLGNAYEWVWDWFHTYPEPVPADWTGPEAGSEKVRRGGGWHSGLPYARPAYRGRTPPGETLFTLGLRLGRDPEPVEE